MFKIREKAKWDENRNDWKMPYFYINEKE